MLLDHAPLLLIEADELMQELTGFRLELLGFRVLRATTGHLGLKAAEQAPPAVILISAKLPDLDGLDLLQQLSSSQATASTPRLFLSEDSDLNQVERAYRAGAHDYLVVPYDPSILEQKVRRLLEKRSGSGPSDSRTGTGN